ncbi:MAG: GNAT family N-acetyltransferase [Pseudomonadota bacterium]
MMHVRAAGPMDARAMAELLGEIIEKGGTTAMTEPVSRDDLVGWMRHYSGQNAWFLAEDNEGGLLGFQWIEPKDSLPRGACDIATFTRVGRIRLGTGSALFEATRRAAMDLGYDWINATIRADNSGGLAYYQSRGFETYQTQRDVPLANGERVDRVKKRFNLR